MILIADSGSTKTIWTALHKDGKSQSCHTSGINPFFMEKEEIRETLRTEFSLSTEGISSVYFYGAGCISFKKAVLEEVLSDFFSAKKTEIHSDLLGAARSLCQTDPGVACILGTGSNSCYYDGHEIVRNVSPLGFILGDEGSGAVLGRKLVGNILKNQTSEEIRKAFFEDYPLEIGDFIEQIYRKPFPNRYLAQFTRFIAKHIKNPEISDLVEAEFDEFISRNLMQYEEIRIIPVHFTGSIAFYFKEILIRSLRKENLRMGNITRNPMEGLVRYHELRNNVRR